MIQPYLEDLECRLDDAVEDRLFSEWKDFSDGNMTGGPFLPRHLRNKPSSLDWPAININDAIHDFELMALKELAACSKILAEDTGALLMVRCNYGTGIVPSLFDVEPFIMPRETNTLPTNKPLAGGKDAIRRVIDRGVPDITKNLGGSVFEMTAKFQEWFRPYPKIQKYIPIYHPDFQGPMDICELLWGSNIFVDLVDSPDLVLQLLELVTETYICLMRKWRKVVPPVGDYAFHWGMLHKGQIMIRDDSAMNLSPRMFKTFIEPYDQRLLDEFGGGAIHFCGKGDHFISRAADMPGVYAVHMSQPEYNDLEKILACTVDHDIHLIGMQRKALEPILAAGRDLRGHVQCFNN